LFRKRRKLVEEGITAIGSKVKASDGAVEGDLGADDFSRKSPYECCIDSEVEGRDLSEDEYTKSVLACISDIIAGVDTCTLTLLLVLGEGAFLESRPGQARLVGFH
jgi:hypothetical protein